MISDFGLYIKKYPKISSILLSLFIPLLAKVFFGFYYEDYETFFTALLSNVLTPGMIYTHLYYMMHLGGLASLYAHIAHLFGNFPILSVIEYCYIFISTTAIFYLFIKKTQFFNPFTLVFLTAVFLEYYILLNSTRVSLLLLLTSGLYFIYIVKNKSPFFSRYTLIFLFFWTLGIFTRVETAGVILCLIAGVFLILVHVDYKWKLHIKYYFLLSFSAVSFLVISNYIHTQLEKSNEFYLQIEPECEIEIMFKQNVIPISEMQSSVDSMRYQAVIKGLWGDAKTNDAEFLKSLIQKNQKGAFFYLKEKSEYFNLLKAFLTTYQFYLLAFLLLIIYSLFIRTQLKRSFKIWLLVYQALSLLLIITIAVQFKFTDRVTVPLLTGCMMYHFFVINLYKSGEEKSVIAPFSFFVLFFALITKHCTEISKTHKIKLEQSRSLILNNPQIEHAQTLVLSKTYTERILKTYRPLQKMDLFQNKKIFIVENLAFNTIQPYKTYLTQELNCDPEDYTSLLSAIEKYDPEALYLFSDEERAFLKRYMKIVHGMNWDK